MSIVAVFPVGTLMVSPPLFRPKSLNLRSVCLPHMKKRNQENRANHLLRMSLSCSSASSNVVGTACRFILGEWGGCVDNSRLGGRHRCALFCHGQRIGLFGHLKHRNLDLTRAQAPKNLIHWMGVHGAIKSDICVFRPEWLPTPRNCGCRSASQKKDVLTNVAQRKLLLGERGRHRMRRYQKCNQHEEMEMHTTQLKNRHKPLVEIA